MPLSTDLAADYLRAVSAANTERAKKEAFILYLTDVFQGDEAAREIISQLAGGAERKVLNIPKTTRDGETNKTGFADTQYRQVIIEFENAIKTDSKRRHAEYQLQEYFAGNFNSGQAYDYVLIATDCVRWAVYGAKPESYFGKNHLLPEDVELKVVDSLVLTDATLDLLFPFIDRYLFRFEKQTPTLDTILIDFGDSSALFVNVFGQMKAFYDTIRAEPEIGTAYQQWHRFMSVA